MLEAATVTRVPWLFPRGIQQKCAVQVQGCGFGTLPLLLGLVIFLVDTILNQVIVYMDYYL